MIMYDSANCFSVFLLVLLSIIIVDNAKYNLCLICSLLVWHFLPRMGARHRAVIDFLV